MDEDERVAAIADGVEFEVFVRRALDPTLVPRGFTLTPQHGFGIGSQGRVIHSAIYEASPDDYARRYPRLGARFVGDVPCIDFWVHRIDATDPPHLRCELEGAELSQMLHDGGHTKELDRLRRSLTEPLDAQLMAVADAVRAVLDSASVKDDGR